MELQQAALRQALPVAVPEDPMAQVVLVPQVLPTIARAGAGAVRAGVPQAHLVLPWQLQEELEVIIFQEVVAAQELHQ
jgi:hypothetical protein